MIIAQEWLNNNYPLDKRKDVTNLDIRYRNLEGSLRLEKFNNLEIFFCSGNGFTNLNISNCTKLKELDCSFNNLTSLSLPRSLEELKKFSGSDNNLTNLDFSFFNTNNLISLK